MPRDASGNGALLRELARYDIMGVCAGGYGESGQNLDKILHIVSEGMARKHFIRMGYDSPRDAFGVCARRVRREFGMAAMRGQAAQIHRRVEKADVTQRVAHEATGEVPLADESFFGEPDNWDLFRAVSEMAHSREWIVDSREWPAHWLFSGNHLEPPNTGEI